MKSQTNQASLHFLCECLGGKAWLISRDTDWHTAATVLIRLPKIKKEAPLYTHPNPDLYTVTGLGTSSVPLTIDIHVTGA